MLFGEVPREFQHVITGVIMCKVDFSGVLGIYVVPKENCEPVAEENLVGVGACVEDINNDANEVPTEASTFTLDLPPYLDVVGDDNNDEVSDPD